MQFQNYVLMKKTDFRQRSFPYTECGFRKFSDRAQKIVHSYNIYKYIIEDVEILKRIPGSEREERKSKGKRKYG